MEEVQRAIDERYADPDLSATRLAEEFGFSISYLSRTFKKAAGVGLNDYLHSVRISHAKELLRNTDLPINDIAAQVGFSSASAFIRAYRAAEAITPGAYRERAQRLTAEN
jgi:AraC-like DNA-binding protein